MSGKVGAGWLQRSRAVASGAAMALMVGSVGVAAGMAITTPAASAAAATSTPTPTVYAWGASSYGQTGTGGSTMDVDTPAAVALPGGVSPTAVAAGALFSLALGSDGNVYAWGDNTHGQLGNGSAGGEPSFTPAKVDLPVTASAIAAGDAFGLAIGSDGNLYA